MHPAGLTTADICKLGALLRVVLGCAHVIGTGACSVNARSAPGDTLPDGEWPFPGEGPTRRRRLAWCDGSALWPMRGAPVAAARGTSCVGAVVVVRGVTCGVGHTTRPCVSCASIGRGKNEDMRMVRQHESAESCRASLTRTHVCELALRALAGAVEACLAGVVETRAVAVDARPTPRGACLDCRRVQ